MSDVQYTSRSFAPYAGQYPTSPPPPPPEHFVHAPLPPSLNSANIDHSYVTENFTFTNNTPDSRSPSPPTQPSNDHHHGNAPAAEEPESTANSASLPRAISLSSLIRDETPEEDAEHPQMISISTSNPSHLFWVPAEQHPEIAPREFEKFLQTNSIAKRKQSSIRRRSSILSVSFTASDAQRQEENEREVQGDSRKDTLEALERGRQQPPGQDHSSQGDQGSQRKTRLRRSISLDMINAAEKQMRVPDFLVFDRNSSAVDQSRVLVPRADRPSLLRRGARTKFQRNSSFTPPSARHVDRHRQTESMPPNAYSERFERFEGSVTLSDGPLEAPPVSASPLSSPYADEPAEINFSPRPVERRVSAEEIPRMQENPIPARMEDEVQALGVGQNVSAPEPVEHTAHELEAPVRPPSAERKSSWSWGFKRSKSEQVRSDIHVDKVHSPAAEPVPRPRPSASTETSSNTTATPTAPGKKGFGLSSLFSRKNSSSKVQPAATTVAPSVPKDFQLNRINQNRLPIHIERAIYRLSHSKLANPRRPLHEQVLISNLMFWYLSLVSSPQAQLQAAQQQQSQPNGSNPANKAKKFVPAGKKGKRRPPANSSSPRPQQQQQHGRPTSPSNASLNSSQPHKARGPQKHDNGNAALHPLMGPSTGFVVPENYLKPGSKGMAGVGRRSSLSDSDEDEDDTGQSDSSSDEEASNSNVTMKARAAAATKHRASNDAIPNHTRTAKRRGSDDVPLAMYRKGKA